MGRSFFVGADSAHTHNHHIGKGLAALVSDGYYGPAARACLSRDKPLLLALLTPYIDAKNC
jgi:hypothetical protein